jgi:hypothetical protein
MFYVHYHQKCQGHKYMELRASICKAINFGVLAAACGAISGGQAGFSSTILSSTVAASFILAGEDAYGFIDFDQRQGCLLELHRIHRKVENMVRANLPEDHVSRSHVSAALADFDSHLPKCVPTSRTLAHCKMNAQVIAETTLQHISKHCGTIRPVGNSAGVWHNAPDPANFVVRTLLHETLLHVLASKDVAATLARHFAVNSIEHLEILLLNALADARQNKEITAMLKDLGPDLRFNNRIYRLKTLADEASVVIRASKREIDVIEGAVEVLRENV